MAAQTVWASTVSTTSRSTLSGTAPARASKAEGADRFGEALFDVHPAGVPLDDLLGGAGQVVGDQDGGFVVTEAGDGDLPQCAGVAAQGGGGVVDDLDSAGLAASAGDRHCGPGLGEEVVEGGGQLGVRARKVMKVMPRAL